MRIHLLFITILTVALFSAIDTNAQTTLYPATQPVQDGDPFQIERIINDWVNCNGETKDGGKVYRSLGCCGPASQPTAVDAGCEKINFDCHYVSGAYTFSYGYEPNTAQMGMFYFKHECKYIINQDNNLLITLGNGDQLLALTDELMKGILVIREVAK